eukprot:Pompholyxophrys_punicea_v1_NODE_3_length_10569_cov_612.508655.p5 type:complete len:134 gc:universal NODE_3_length_10569_cov_612.508655:6183-5782(-)
MGASAATVATPVLPRPRFGALHLPARRLPSRRVPALSPPLSSPPPPTRILSLIQRQLEQPLVSLLMPISHIQTTTTAPWRDPSTRKLVSPIWTYWRQLLPHLSSQRTLPLTDPPASLTKRLQPRQASRVSAPG